MAVRIALLLTVLIHADMASGQATLIHEWTGRGFKPYQATLTPDGRYVLMVGAWTGNAEGDQPEFRAWDVHTREFVGEHRLDARGRILGLDVAPDGETLLVVTDTQQGKGGVSLWNWQARRIRTRSTRVRSSLTPIRRLLSVRYRSGPAPRESWIWWQPFFSPDADLFAVVRRERVPYQGHSRVYDEIEIREPSGQLQATIVPPDSLRGGLYGLSFSPDGRRLATTTLFDDAPQEGGYVVRVDLRLWDVQSGEELAQRSVTDSAVSRRTDLASLSYFTIAFSPDGSLIASEGVDHTIQLWDADTLEPVRRLGEIRHDCVASLAISPDSRLLVAAADLRRNRGFESQLLLWEVATGEVLLRIDEDLAEIDTVEFSPDGGWLLTRGGIAPDVPGSAVRLWDVNHLLAIGADAEQTAE